MATEGKYVLHRGKSSSQSLIGKARTITKEHVDIIWMCYFFITISHYYVYQSTHDYGCIDYDNREQQLDTVASVKFLGGFCPVQSMASRL